MKKMIFGVLLLVCVALAGVTAEEAMAGGGAPDYFTFGVGAMPYFEFTNNTVQVLVPFSMQFHLNDMFSTGLSFADFGAANLTLLNVTVMPVDNAQVTLSVGQIGGNIGFGLGLGYDFLVRKKMLFSSLGFYVDWLASDAAAGVVSSIREGGLLSFGLKTRFGL